MILLRVALAVLVVGLATNHAVAQDSYTVPRTEHGHPDFRGVWSVEFLTGQERPPGVENLVVNPAQAEGMVAAIKGFIANDPVIDPDVFIHDISQLARVKGEYRTSIVVDPENGLMPYSEAGLDLVSWGLTRDNEMFDYAAQRPLVERCMESFSYPPMRAIPFFVPAQIFQNSDNLVMLMEDASGLRIIRLDGEPPPELEKPLLALAARYLLTAKRDGRAADPVANFHLANGARVERLAFLADHSPVGLARSAGVMVNYVYKLDEIDANHEAYTGDGTIAATAALRAML